MKDTYLIAHACNPSTLRGRGREITIKPSANPIRVRSYVNETKITNIKLNKKQHNNIKGAGVETQYRGSEFNPQ